MKKIKIGTKTYYVQTFGSYAAADRMAAHGVGLNRVLLGCDGRYWVADSKTAAVLETAGYERA